MEHMRGLLRKLQKENAELKKQLGKPVDNILKKAKEETCPNCKSVLCLISVPSGLKYLYCKECKTREDVC